ncbi:unnamed protein product [Rotaria sp. Silwood1]|nr:unnamed protein product [Rotaria sp. Silwood1]
MQRLLCTYFILLLIYLLTVIESKKSCSINTGKRETSSSIRHRHGLFETTQLNLTIEKFNIQHRNSKIDWIRNITYQSPFVAVTTYDRDVILSEYEYNPIAGLRIARVTPENQVVWNYTYDLTAQSSIVIVHKQLESIWFAQYSQSTNSSYLIGLHAINGTVRHNFTILNYINFQVDLQSAHICAVSYDYLWKTPNFTLQCFDASLPKRQLLWTTNLTMADKVSTYNVFVSSPAINSKIKRVYLSTIPGYIYPIGYGNNSLMGIDLLTGKLLYQNWLYTAEHWLSIGHPLSSANDDGIVYLSGRTLMAFNGENGTLRFLRARPATYDQRVDSSINDTTIININYLGDFTFRQILSLWDGDKGQLLWNVSVPNSNFYVNYPVTTTVRTCDRLHLTAQDYFIIGRLPSSNEPVWRFNTSVAQGRVARLGVTNETLFVVVVYYEHQELWKISLPQSFIEQQQQDKHSFSSNYTQCGAYCNNYTDCLLYSCGKCVDNRCTLPDPSPSSCKNEGDCNQMITTCLSGFCRTMWPDCFGQCNSYWTKCYSIDCPRCTGYDCQS